MEITDKTFEEEVLRADIPVFVDFWASWCLPCKAIETILNELKKEYDGRVKICKMNVDRNRVTAQKYDIFGLPTYIIFKEGSPVYREMAAKSKKEFKMMIEEYCLDNQRTKNKIKREK